MLILARNPGETINIGDDIEIAVLGVKGNRGKQNEQDQQTGI